MPIAWLQDVMAQPRSLEDVRHRPWPLSTRTWVIGQTWRRLLFAHWPVARDVLRLHVPEPLVIEERDGFAWITLAVFRVDHLRLHGLPPLPALSRFQELNCRTYVRQGGRPGVWFFSLDASSPLAVEAARLTYHLPYRHAAFDVRGERVAVWSPGATLRAEYRGLGEPAAAQPGTLEQFLVERYCLYAAHGTLRADIHHAAWPLQAAEASVEVDGIAPVPLEGEPIFHYVGRQDAVIWAPERFEPTSPAAQGGLDRST
jgi:uncharacterized protein